MRPHVGATQAAHQNLPPLQVSPLGCAEAAAHLDEIPGIGPVGAAAIIAEIGVDMSRFPTAGHLCSWAKFAPGISASAGKTKRSASSGHGSPYLARVLGEAAVGTSKTNAFLAARYRRIARRRGQPRAGVGFSNPSKAPAHRRDIRYSTAAIPRSTFAAASAASVRYELSSRHSREPR